MTTLTLNKSKALKVLNFIKPGLVKGLGNAKAGETCVEGAVCLALGLPHSDNPPCVGSAVRSFKISLNDSKWSTNEARAKGMRKLAIAQLGSNEIDQVEFSKKLAIKCTQKIVPIALRAAAKLQTKEHAYKLQSCAVICEGVKDLNAARAASDAARAASDASDASDAARAARAASDASDAEKQNQMDRVLTVIADCALEVLIELKSPGCKWLDLCE